MRVWPTYLASPRTARARPSRARAIRARHISLHHPIRARAPIHGRATRRARQCAHAVRSATERVRARMGSIDGRFGVVVVRRDAIASWRRTLVTTTRRAVEDFFVVDDIVVVANKVLEESIAACIASRSAAARGDLCGQFFEGLGAWL